jgi:glycosyltransferase involved in cell wall biosynthesis
LLGQFSSATGLGVTVRQVARALQARGIAFAGYNISSYFSTSDVVSELQGIAPHLVSGANQLTYPISLYCIPVFETARVLDQLTTLNLGPGRFHAGLVWWEATRMNPAWTQALSRLDAVVTFSDFLGEVLANSVQLTPVVRGNHPLEIPTGVCASRADFGLPQDAVVFLGSLDPSSDPDRKNPLATIKAFRAAFPREDTGVRLLLRVNNADATPMAQQAVQSMFGAADGDSRIGFLLEPMNYAQVLSLFASADVYVSLHRSEGLGLSMLESMRLGIPVIATGWSGNMSFMDHRCAMLLRYRLVDVRGQHPFNKPEMAGKDAQWAEPVIEDAIVAMQLLRNAPEVRARLGALGRGRAEQYQEKAATMGWVDELRSLWDNAALFPGVRGKLGAEQGD